MDTISLDDVRMCGEAVEIQSLVDKPKGLDFDHFRTGWDRYGRIWFKQASAKLVWIPYQEDLQLIASHKSPRGFERIDFIFTDRFSPTEMRTLHNSFNNFVDVLSLNEGIQIKPRLGQFYNRRQLWLAFAMQEKYGKMWSGNTWVEPKIKQEVRIGSIF